VGVAPGFFIMSHLHQTSLLLRTTLFLIDEARTLLDTFTLFPGKEKLEGAVSAALTLLETGLRLSDSFISGARSAGASEVFTDLAKLLLGLNPRSGRPDHLFNVSRFILYGYWLPGARLSAVKIIRDVAASPANQASILATFTASEPIQQSVLKAFTEALDADEVEDADMDSDEAEGKDHAGATRLAIMDLLLTGVTMSAPSVAHFLLGFDLRLGVGKSQLQPPSVCGVRSCLHALLSLVAPSSPCIPPQLATTSPHLCQAAYRLIHTLASQHNTSESVLRFLRSSEDFVASQVACVPALLTSNSLQAEKSVAWLLKTAAVEIRVLASSRQHGQLGTILGLLLDAIQDTDEPELGSLAAGGGASTSLYSNATFSQLSRTMAHTDSQRQMDSPVSNHRLATILNSIQFEMDQLSAPTWQLFDDSQVAGVLEQCQVQGSNSATLVDIPKLHKILAAELATIQGAAAMNQRAMIQSEIQSILLYAVKWNSVQEGAAARRDILDSWRQVVETLITVTPKDLLPASSKQQILLQILQSLINKVSCENPVSGLDNLVSSTVLLLLSALRATYEGVPDKRDVMGDTFVGILDTTSTESSSQVFSSSLQIVLRGLISWLLASGAGSQAVRTNLYAAMLAYLRIGKVSDGSDGGEVLELSERGKLQKANLEVVRSFGVNLLEGLARDATTGHEVRRMLALSVLDELINLDRQGAIIRFLSSHGFLKHVIESLTDDEPGLIELLTKTSGNIRCLYVFETKVNLLVRTACNPVGAESLLQVGLMARLAEFSVLSLRPDPDAALLSQGDDGSVSLLQRYHSILFPVLRLCEAVMASLGADNVSAAAQVLQCLVGHSEIISLILRGSAARASLHPALLSELSLVSSCVSRAATLVLTTADQADAATIELSGQQARMQRQMISLLNQFQLSESLVSSLATVTPSPPTLPLLQIIHNVISYACNLVSASSTSPRSTRLVVSPGLLEAGEGVSDGPALSSRPASLGLLVVTLRNLGAQLARSQNALLESQDRLSSLSSLPLTELCALAGVSPGEKLPTAMVRKMAGEKVSMMVGGRSKEVSLCTRGVEGLSFLILRHLEHFLLYSTAAESAGPSTPYQQAVSRHNRAQKELGSVPLAPRTGFSKVDLEKLKNDASTILNDSFFDKLNDNLSLLERGSGSSSVNQQLSDTSFLQSVLRRLKRLASLHTQ